VNGWLYPAAVLVGFTLAAVGLSVFLLLRAQSLLRVADAVLRSQDAVVGASMAELKTRLDALSCEVRELERLPSFAGDNSRAGLNITRRTQVLRMHKRGEGNEAIAAALGLRRHEVELLVKIHAMAMSGVS
jgi:DNA-binding NarL/FixJ family response regulator